MDIKVFVLAIAIAATALAVDFTIEEDAVGTDVVLATISKIETSGIFPSDRRLLRRIAHVETDDGTTPDPTREPLPGGIWKVGEENFLAGNKCTLTYREPLPVLYSIFSVLQGNQFCTIRTC